MTALTDVPEPVQRLAPAARWAWRASWLGGCIVAAFVLAMVDSAIPDGWTAPLVALLAVVLVVGVVVVPELRWRRWRWEVREHEIDLRHGTWAVTRTIVPMARVQHVTTRRDPLQQALDLATVVVHTAAGANEIPSLTVAEAAQVRDRIAELARTPDEL